MSNFSFLQEEWLAIHDSASKAESYLNTDCRAACWYARMTLEQMVNWVYQVDPNFRCYEESLGARVHDPSFRHNAGESIFTKATLVIAIGNRAAHAKATKRTDALTAITELFHIAYWLARTYGTRQRPNPALQFNPALIPNPPQARSVSVEELAKQEERLKQQQQQAENEALKALGCHPPRTGGTACGNRQSQNRQSSGTRRTRLQRRTNPRLFYRFTVAGSGLGVK
jgi:type I restriction enzyme, R subunit